MLVKLQISRIPTRANLIENPTDLGGMAEIFPDSSPRVCATSLFLSFFLSLSPIARQEDEMKMYIAGPVRRTCPPPPSYRLTFPPPPLLPLGNPCRREAAGESVRG